MSTTPMRVAIHDEGAPGSCRHIADAIGPDGLTGAERYRRWAASGLSLSDFMKSPNGGAHDARAASADTARTSHRTTKEETTMTTSNESSVDDQLPDPTSLHDRMGKFPKRDADRSSVAADVTGADDGADLPDPTSLTGRMGRSAVRTR